MAKDLDREIYEDALKGEPDAPSPEPRAPSPPPSGERDEPAPPAAARQGETTVQADEPTPAPHMVPLRELLDTRERAQRAEQERQEFARRLEHYERQRQAEEAARRAQPVQVPDMFMDPDAYSTFVQQQIDARVAAVTSDIDLKETRRAFKRAEKEYGEDWPKAWQAFNAAATQSQPLQQAFLQLDPSDRGDEIMSWYRQQNLVREVGSDPAAYEKRLREKLLNDPEFIAQVSAQASPQYPRNVTRLPPSLNSRTGGGARAPAGAVDYGSDQDIWDAGNAPSRRG